MQEVGNVAMDQYIDVGHGSGLKIYHLEGVLSPDSFSWGGDVGGCSIEAHLSHLAACRCDRDQVSLGVAVAVSRHTWWGSMMRASHPPYLPAPRQATVYYTEVDTLPRARHAELPSTLFGNTPTSSLAAPSAPLDAQHSTRSLV